MKFNRIFSLCALGLGTVGAFADTGPDLTAVTAAGVSVGIVGAAVFAVIVGARTWKWIRAAL